MEFKQVTKDEPAKAGDKFRLTFNVLTWTEQLWGIISPSWQAQVYEQKIAAAIEKMKSQESGGGFRILDVESQAGDKKLIVDIQIVDPGKLQKGIGVIPFAIVGAVIQLLMVATIVVGVNMALSRVDKIVEKPIPAIGFVIALGLAAYFLIDAEIKKRAKA